MIDNHKNHLKNIVYDLEKLDKKINNLSVQERKELNEILEKESIKYFLNVSYVKNNKSKIKKNVIEDFSFDVLMPKLRHTILYDVKDTDNLVEIDWLLKIMMLSKSLFKTTKEVDIFLSNITGFMHDTKSTGRDRIVDWYFNKIRELSLKEQNKVYYDISKYLFINIPSNYKEWKKILYKGGR
ncbi:hypothetical protein ACH0CI_15855 [Priestia sp. 179-F W1.4 NHS]|uniref:hypothetical protein n=1 Tax=Priestia sp. 179-F W1.4 NHS TaxID=3374296 RepID=UPI00387A069C